MSKFLIAGLGNIGADYAGTRHNIGFDIADAFVSKHGVSFKSDRLADTAEVSWKGKRIVVIKPTTYMNLSGRAVKYWIDREKVPIHQTLVIIDELALPLNKIRLRPSGSPAGHNGLKSVEEALGTDQYPKLRFGIGNNFPKGRQVDYVLGKWNDEELPIVKHKVHKCVEVIESFVSIGIERTMNEVNKLEFTL
jgi:peptidyl-tRNA hydrolase, PTH1 family